MSNIIPADNAVTITKPAKKLIQGINAETLALRALPHGGATVIKPSDIKMDNATANGNMGGKLTPEGFLKGLMFKTVRLAWGACTLEQAIRDLPKFAQFAIEQAHSKLMGTSGITAGELRSIVVQAFNATAELPVATKVAKVETPSPVQISAPTQEPDEAPKLIEESKRAERIHNMRHMQALNEKAGILLDFQRMQERDQERENAKRNTIEFRQKAVWEALSRVDSMQVFREMAKNIVESDESELRAMMAELGYELRRKPVKKAA